MDWIATSERLPDALALVYAGGDCHLAELIGRGTDSAAFIDINSSDLLPWPSYWMPLPEPPADN